MKTKLTREQICRIPKLRKAGHTFAVIAQIYGVNAAAIRRVVEFELWKQFEVEQGKPARCPGCGCKVINDMEPCRNCEAEKHEENKRLLRRLTPDSFRGLK